MSHEFDDRDRESVVRDLRDADDEVRRLALERVEILPASDAVGHLVACLGDVSWRVRKTAVERLVASPAAEEVSGALVSALGDGENPGRRNAALEALIQIGARVVPTLLDASSSEDADIRKQAVDVLAGIADPTARWRLLELLGDADPNVRAAAADALGGIGGESASRALLRVATTDDEDQLVRFSAVHALAALEYPARAVDLSGLLDHPVLGPAGLGLLGRADDEDSALEVLLKALVGSSRAGRESAMRSILRVVGRVDPTRTPLVVARIRRAVAASVRVVMDAVARLEDADLPTRLVLVQFLGLIANPETVIPVLRAGRDEALSEVAQSTLEAFGEGADEIIDADWPVLDADSRRNACALFGRTSGETGAARLVAAVEEEGIEIRMTAARAIGRRRLAAGLPPLVRRIVAAASDDDFESEDELAALTDGITELASPTPGNEAMTARAIDLLATFLDASSEDVRLAVARVVGRIGRPQDSEMVGFLLRDPSSRVRRAAVEALAHLEPGTAAEPLRLALADDSASVRIAAANALGESRTDEVAADLERLAEDEDPRVRAAAAGAVVLRFAHSSDPAPRATAERVLDSALADEPPVVLAVLEAMREHGGPDAKRAVELLGRPEPELVREAIRCLAAHADLDGVEQVIPLVSHPDWSVRAEAIQTLADRGLAKGVPAILRRLETESDDFVRGVTLRALERLESEMR